MNIKQEISAETLNLIKRIALSYSRYYDRNASIFYLSLVLDHEIKHGRLNLSVKNLLAYTRTLVRQLRDEHVARTYGDLREYTSCYSINFDGKYLLEKLGGKYELDINDIFGPLTKPVPPSVK